MLISLDSPDDPFNHVLRMTVLIWCPTRFTFKGAVDVGRRGPDGGLTNTNEIEQKKLVNECNQREAACLGLPVMTKYVPRYVLPALPVCVN